MDSEGLNGSDSNAREELETVDEFLECPLSGIICEDGVDAKALEPGEEKSDYVSEGEQNLKRDNGFAADLKLSVEAFLDNDEESFLEKYELAQKSATVVEDDDWQTRMLDRQSVDDKNAKLKTFVEIKESGQVTEVNESKPDCLLDSVEQAPFLYVVRIIFNQSTFFI
jgi:hypothetical protein